MNDQHEPAADEARRPTPAAALLALGLGRTEAALDDEEGEDAELEQFLCAQPDLELHGCLGRGGMGRVYRARQIRLDRFVAVKLMNAELGSDPEFRDRFEREARALARLDHPGVVRVHDFGEAGGLFYLIMELVDGPSLRDLIARGIEPEEATRIIGQLCDALAYAHARGVVHRDIKPENVLIDRAGRVRVADFGLAKLQQVDHRATTRRIVGTPQYMAPEQLSDPGSVDHRADVFAIGVVFYEMLTGQLPVGRFPSPSELGHGDPHLDRVVLRALESSREKRFQAASEIREALDSRAVDDPATVTRPLDDAAARRRSPSRAWIFGGVAAAGVAAAVVVASWGPVAEEPVVVQTEEPAEIGPVAEPEPVLAVEPEPEPAMPPNRWPASDLVLLAADTVLVVGMDWGDLRQAPALASLQSGLGDDPAWKQCYAEVVARTHKMIVALDTEGEPTEVVAHGDWAPTELASCLRAATAGKKKVSVVQESLGDYTRITAMRGKKPVRSIVVGKEGARLWVSLRKDVDEARAEELFGARASGSDLGQRLGGKVDLGAPIWVLADPVPKAWETTPTSGWGHLNLWEKLEFDAVVNFANEEDAAGAVSLVEGYGAILSNLDDGPKLDLHVERVTTRVAITGALPIPKDGSGTFKLTPEDDSGLGLKFSFSD